MNEWYIQWYIGKIKGNSTEDIVSCQAVEIVAFLDDLSLLFASH